MNNDFKFPDKIRCLYFDDEEDQRIRFADHIIRSWNELKTRVPIEVETAETIEESNKKLKNASEKFHIFFADILVKKDNNFIPVGNFAIRNARQDDPNLAIIALTVGSGEIHEEKLKQIGCDKLVIKGSLYDDFSNLLGNKMIEALKQHKIEPSSSKASLEFNQLDLPLKAVIDTIGRENFINLTERIINQPCNAIKASYIRAGYSGASVTRVTCEFDVYPTILSKASKQNLLLKTSRDKKSLKNELKKDTSVFPNGLFIPFLKDKIVDSGSWYAIGSDFKDNSKTLIDYLKDKSVTQQKIKKTLDSLFQNSDRGLFIVYKQMAIDDRKPPNIVLWEILNSHPYRKATIQLAIEEFTQIIKNCDKSKFFNQELIEIFLNSKRIDQLDEEKFTHFGTSFCISHGDLHGRNILVSDNDFGYLIDPANIDTMHWATDIARLSVDLIVSAYDSNENSYYFENVDDWCNLFAKFIHGENLSANVTGDTDTNKNVCTAIDYLRAQIFICHNNNSQKPTPEWEFRLALAVEFLRSAYRVKDLSAPKRILGLLLACEALRASSTAFKEYKNNLEA